MPRFIAIAIDLEATHFKERFALSSYAITFHREARLFDRGTNQPRS